jgi:hypothetical protein
MDDLQIFICFPDLRKYDLSSTDTFLSVQDQDLWFDSILLPCLNTAVASSSKKQYYPASKRVADQDATATASEGFARKFSSRTQILHHTIQQKDLELLWPLVCDKINEAVAMGAPEARFANPLLFISDKNSKLQYMRSGAAKDMLRLLPEAYDAWLKDWTNGMDERFYSKDDTFIDLAKQTTSPDSALPFDPLQPNASAEVYLWKTCCLQKYLATRQRHCRRRRQRQRDKRKRDNGNLEVTYYPFATFGKAGGMTIASKYGSLAYKAGLIYSQFYSLIKVPFDAAKVYIFNNEALENLALDPAYVRALRHVSGAVSFSPKVCEISYLHSKSRANVNLEDNRWRSYGVREEHRLSMRAVEEIVRQWRQWQNREREESVEEDLYGVEDERNARVELSIRDLLDEQDPQLQAPLPLPLPYYIFSSLDMFAFLRAQLNRYCFLFEYIYAWTGKTHSLPEFIMMVLALRALRFSYGSGILAAESLLWKDQWQNKKGRTVEGIGMKKTMLECGFGWFLPKINWSTMRPLPPHTDHFLAGNLLLHSEYKRRWKAVRDLGDVYTRLHQAEGWVATHKVKDSKERKRVWLEYLTALNIRQFHADIIQHVLKSHKTHPELSATATAPHRLANLSYCFQGMCKMFEDHGEAVPPHTATGNVVAITSTWDLVELLFGWDDTQSKSPRGWQNKTYRLIFHKTYDTIMAKLGEVTAQRWYDRFLATIILTHWILPYATATAFLPLTKTNKKKGLKGRTIWFSSILQEPPGFWTSSWPGGFPRTLSDISRVIRRDTALRGSGGWQSEALIQEYLKYGLSVGSEKANPFRLGFEQNGTTLLPVWELGKPLVLQMVTDIHDKTLDQLDIYMQQAFAEAEVERL